ncbi:MAG: tetratricopeptide repeat protein [Aggregatilineaceae bacterium]
MNSQFTFEGSSPIHDSQRLPQAPRLPLVGRQADLEAVRQALRTGVPVMVVGQAGVGKSALAHTLAEDYVAQPGGVLWLESADETALALANRVARAYGAETCAARDEEGMLTFFRRVHGLLVAQRPLVVLDGHVRPEAAREFVRACAPGIPVLLTGSRPAAGPWTLHELAPLEHEASIALLAQSAGYSTERAEELGGVAEALGGNALSLSVAGLQLAAGHTAEEFLAQMPPLPPGPGNRVMATLMAGYRLLPQELQGMVMLIGTAFAGRTSEEFLCDATGAPPESLSARMRQLVERGFAAERIVAGLRIYAAHEMVQRFAQAFLRGKHRLDTMRARHLHAVPVFVRRHIDERSEEHFARLAAEMPTIIAAGRFAAGQGKHEYLRELIEMMAPVDEGSFVRAAGFMPEYEWLRHLLEAPQANELGALGWVTLPEPVSKLPAPEASTAMVTEKAVTESAAEAEIANETDQAEEQPVALTPSVSAEPVEAVGEREEIAIESAPLELPEAQVMPPTSPEEPEGTKEANSLELPADAETLNRLGQAVREQDDPHTLIARYAQAAQSFKADGKVDDELAALEALAMLSLEDERYDEVLAYIDQGMKLAQETDNPQREGELLVVLGDLQVSLERWDGAEAAYKQAIAAFRPTEAWLDIGLALDKLGSVYWETGRSQEAAETWEQAVPLFERVERSDLLREVLHKVADTRAELLQWDSARTAGERLLALARAAGDRAAECEQLLWLGTLRESQGDREGAQQFYRGALYVSFGLPDPDWRGRALLALARLMIDETVHLNRTLQLLEAAESLLPGDTEVQRLLKRAKTRQERLIRGGVTLPVASSSLQEYARQAYEALISPD